MPASHDDRRSDALPYFEAVAISAYRNNYASKLVAENMRRSYKGIATPPTVPIRSTNTACNDFDNDSGRGNIWVCDYINH